MEKLLTFDIARKLTVSDKRTKGLIVKSLTGDQAQAVILVATGSREGNDRMRAACDDFRLRTGKNITCEVRGKSVRVTVKDDRNAVLCAMEFGAALPLIQDDLLECFAFVVQYRPADPDSGRFELYGADCSEGAFSAYISLLCDEDTDDEAVFRRVMSALEPYNMGIVRHGL